MTMARSTALIMIWLCVQQGCTSDRTTEKSGPQTFASSRDEAQVERQRIISSQAEGYAGYVHRSGAQRFLVFEGVPEYVHGLAFAPVRREPELTKGTWLLLVYHVLSVRDTACIHAAIAAGKEFRGRIQVGIRGYADEQEHRTWCPECLEQADVSTPIWLLIRNGRTLGVYRGVMNRDEVVRWIHESERT